MGFGIFGNFDGGFEGLFKVIRVGDGVCVIYDVVMCMLLYGIGRGG